MNLFPLTRDETHESIDQSRSRNRMFQRPQNFLHWILISVLILTILGLPFVVIQSKKFIERTLKLRQGKMSVMNRQIPY